MSEALGTDVGTKSGPSWDQVLDRHRGADLVEIRAAHPRQAAQQQAGCRMTETSLAGGDQALPRKLIKSVSLSVRRNTLADRIQRGNRNPWEPSAISIGHFSCAADRKVVVADRTSCACSRTRSAWKSADYCSRIGVMRLPNVMSMTARKRLVTRHLPKEHNAGIAQRVADRTSGAHRQSAASWRQSMPNTIDVVDKHGAGR